MLRFAICCEVAQWLIRVLNMVAGYRGYPGYLLPFFIGKILLINFIKLLYIAHFSKKTHVG